MNHYASAMTPTVSNTGDDKACEHSLSNWGIAARPVIERPSSVAGQQGTAIRVVRGVTGVVWRLGDATRHRSKVNHGCGVLVLNVRRYNASRRIVIEEGRNYEVTWELDPPCLYKLEEPGNTLVGEIHY